MKLSIVIPVYNEAVNLPALFSAVDALLALYPDSAEAILIDDGSSDDSFELICQHCATHPAYKGLRFTRNYGQTAAMAAGFQQAKGEVIVPMDADLQNNPSDIPRLLDKMEQGYDVVSGWRKHRKDTFITRKLPSVLANALISRMTHVRLHDYGCTLKAYRRTVLDQVQLYGEMHRFIPALAFQHGARIAEIAVDHRPRTAGVSKYGIDRTLRVVLDLVTVKFLLKYSTRPLQLFGKWAFSSFALSLATFLLTIYMKYGEGLSMNRNPLLILSAFLLFSGVQFVTLGLLGELITRTYHEVQNKPIYTISKKVNFDK